MLAISTGGCLWLHDDTGISLALLTGCNLPCFCSTVKTQKCTCAAGVDTCVSLGTCSSTICGICSNCVSSLTQYLLQVQSLNDSTTIALKWRDVCTTVLNPANAAVCDAVQAVVQSDASGNTGKRAGKCRRCGGVDCLSMLCFMTSLNNFGLHGPEL